MDESGKLLFQAPDEEPAEDEEQQQAGLGQGAEMWGELPPDAEVQQEEEDEGKVCWAMTGAGLPGSVRAHS